MVACPTPPRRSARPGTRATGSGFALLLVGVGAFLTIGALQSLYGPSFAALQARYGVSVAQVGGVVSAHFGGAFVGVLASGFALVRLGYRGSLVTAAALIAAGTSVIGLAGTWPLALAAAFVAGLGFGQVTVAVNLMVARAYERAATGPLNALNGTYGLGAVLGPALVALATARLGATPEAGAWVFGTVALGAVAFTLAAARLRWWPQPRRSQRRRRRGRPSARWRSC
jgi:MFS transporter, FHS family, glucose/mannose:H+ symporter